MATFPEGWCPRKTHGAMKHALIMAREIAEITLYADAEVRVSMFRFMRWDF
jgi:hypothetical protein